MAEITGSAARAPVLVVKTLQSAGFPLFDCSTGGLFLVPAEKWAPTILIVIPAEAKRRAGIHKLDMAGFPLSRE
jgi:hypothetical protein